MSQRTPKICQPRGKIVIPIEDGECLYWLIPVDTKEDIENPTRDFAWLDKRGVLYVFDGSKIVPINDPDLLKVKFENVMGSPYDNGELGNELNKRVQTIKMNNETVPMRTNGEVDLGCVTTCEDLERAIAGIETMHCEIVDELPEQGDEQTIYLMPIETEPEYIMPCHDFTFAKEEENLYHTSNFITPTNAIPITNGKSYIVNIGGETYEMTGVVSGLSSGAKQYELSDGGVSLSSLSSPAMPYTQYEDEYSFVIQTDHVIEGATDVEAEKFNATVCVQTKKDTIFRMYIFVDGAYREVGSDKEIQTSCEKDWKENSPNSVKYIENRTHYVDENGDYVTLNDNYLSENVMKYDGFKVKPFALYDQEVVVPANRHISISISHGLWEDGYSMYAISSFLYQHQSASEIMASINSINLNNVQFIFYNHTTSEKTVSFNIRIKAILKKN